MFMVIVIVIFIVIVMLIVTITVMQTIFLCVVDEAECFHYYPGLHHVVRKENIIVQQPISLL